MKKFFPFILIALAGMNALQAQSVTPSNESANTYEVIDGVKYGYTVHAGNLVTLTKPSGEIIQVTKFPFVEQQGNTGYSLPPVSPIICSWDPTGHWLVIFVSTRPTTAMYVFSLKTGERLVVRQPSETPVYPDWWLTEKLSTTYSTPKNWDGNKLEVDTLATSRAGEEHHLPQTITINNNGFTIAPNSSEGKSETPQTTEAQANLTKTKSHVHSAEKLKLFGPHDKFPPDIIGCGLAGSFVATQEYTGGGAVIMAPDDVMNPFARKFIIINRTTGFPEGTGIPLDKQQPMSFSRRHPLIFIQKGPLPGFYTLKAQ